MKQLEYVASGTSHTRILASAVMESPETIDLINSYFTNLNGKNNHKFSLLFNAFTEKDFGAKFKQHYAKSLYTVHADSGGLQIITQGKSITPELKEDVYRTQAKYSDIAMCFDQIPIGVVSEKSDRNDTTGRYFDKTNLEFYSRETGKNIKRQIELFLEEKSSSKPMIIAQGNDYESYMYWVEYILKELPPSYLPYIGGIAMGGAALGTGALEDMERAAYSTNLPFQMEEPYIHILGVGSIRRLLPYLALARSGFFPENLHLSYDSTTHTSGVSIGLYYHKKAMTIGRDYKLNYNEYNTIYNDIDTKYDLSGKGIDVEMFFNSINSNSSYYNDRDNNSIDKDKMMLYYHCLISFISSSIGNFTNKINRCLQSEDVLIEVADQNKVSAEITALLNIDNIDKFLKWKQNVGNSIKSKRIQNVKPQTLDVETNEPVIEKLKSKLNTAKNDKIQTLENFI
jgi:hypothetical protein